MITTSQIAPSLPLAPFVRCYIYREFDTNGANFIKPKHAAHEIAMHFFFKGLPVKLVDPQTGHILKTGKRSGISGLSSQYVGDMTFNGFYSFFEIVFTPPGFHALFNITPAAVMNQILWREEILDSSIDYLHDQLCETDNFTRMAALTDAYLLRRLAKQKRIDYNDRMNFIINAICRNNGLLNIDRLAYDANMSIRNFERRFIEAVGMPAKLFCCITRFNQALALKLRNPHYDWTSVAHETGYYDQMHLIKDFKKFSGDAPCTLLKETPLLVETYVSRV